MAETWVTREELATGDFPATCAITGISADARLPLTFHHQPDWIWILAPLGLPFLIAAVLGTEKVPAQLPVVADAVQSYRRAQGWATMLTVVGFTAATLGLLATSVPVIVVGLASLIAGLTTAGHAGRRFPNGRPDDTGLWVRLLHVHPDFVTAVEARGRAPS